jgi:hypothetical protein
MLIRPAACLLLALLAHSAAAESVPTPQSHFGHPVTEDRKLLDWDKVVSYFHALAQSSDRVRVEDFGKSTEGRTMIAAFIAAPETLRDLDRYRTIQQRLADPRHLADTEATRLLAQGKAIVMVTCSIHSTEVASTHSAIEFAYRMATDQGDRTRAILANTILILVPSLNPDGVDIVTQWYRRTLNTPFEGTNPPELYQKYVGHDNNRDWYIFSQVETRNAVARLHNIWHPQIVYDVHEQGAYASRIFVPPWLDPIDPNVDPILAQTANMIGMNMALELTASGRKGVAVNASYDFWTPSRHYQSYHGGVRILSESAEVKLATPITVNPEQISPQALGFNPRESSWNYLEPWLGGEWRLRDIIQDQTLAMESCLYTAALHRPDLLRNFLTVGRRASVRSSPYAFVIPFRQTDPGAARKLLETLAFGQVEIDRAAGSYVIRMQQPYSAFAKTLLERQHYPDLRVSPGGPPRRPYDVTAQTLPLLMGVEVETLDQLAPMALTPAKSFTFQSPTTAPPGVLRAADTDSWKEINRLWTAGQTVYRDSATGDFSTQPATTRTELKRPRVGLYKSWIPNIDEGWTRWLLEEFGFAYSSLRNSTLQAGDLRRSFDVIVFPSATVSNMTNGYRPGSMPLEFTGGLGQKGLQSLKQFAEAGGRLVFLNESSAYAIDVMGLPVTDVTRGLSPADFYAPGSLLNATIDPADPLTRGLPPNIVIWSERSPAFDPGPGVRAIVKYPTDNILASGWLLGAKHLAEHAAVVQVPVGQGFVILFGMRPQYRAQSYQAFRLLFNTLLG